MRLIVGLFTTLTVVILGTYTFLFTSLGHGVILPIIEGKIKDATKLENVKITEFDLSPSSLNSVILIEKQSIKTDAKFNLFAKDLFLDYEIHIKDLSIFKNLTKQKIRGSFYTRGNIKGRFDNLYLRGDGKVSHGDIKYDLKLKNYQLKDVNFNLSNLQIDKLLYMVYQPLYTKGNLSISGKVASLNPLEGNVVTTINNGVLNNKIIKNDFNITLPSNPNFNLKVNTNLDKNLVISDVSFKSFVANLNTKKTLFDINTQKLTTDYNLLVPSLAKMFFITKQKMRGDIKVDGDIIFDKKLLATFKSEKFGGVIDGKVDGNKLSIDTKDVGTIELLHMMYYPEIFKSKLQLDFDYDIASKKGIAKLDMGNGRFLNTESIKMISKVLRRDISIEVYEIAKITSKIDNSIIDNNIYMKSLNMDIKSKKTLIDTQKQFIDSMVSVQYKKYSLDVKTKGKLTDPDVSLDLNKVVKEKAKEKVVETLEKKLDGKVDDNVKGLLKGFFGN
jgi:hypothetical protein